MSERLDKLLVARGLVPSRERAQGMILAGRVLVNEQKSTKAGALFPDDVSIRLLGTDLPYVSRGGLKLQGALDRWQIALDGRWCVDVGASTGGFTDCMLQRRAAGVVAVDTGYGQMAVPLRDDPRLLLLERCNARKLRPAALLQSLHELQARSGQVTEHSLPVTFIVMDVSFISATLVLPPVVAAVAREDDRWSGEMVVLVKPQFEAGREWVGKGGIVRDPAAHQLSIERVRDAVTHLGGAVVDVAESPITGTEGNREFLLYARFGRESA